MSKQALRFVFLAFALSACGGPLEYQVASTPRAPGSDATLVADVLEGEHQTQIEMRVENLPPPERVAQGSEHYVAWFRKDSRAVWARVGGLAYDSDSRAASFVGSVPEIAFDFQVSAEPEETPAAPSPDIVFAQRVEE